MATSEARAVRTTRESASGPEPRECRAAWDHPNQFSYPFIRSRGMRMGAAHADAGVRWRAGGLQVLVAAASTGRKLALVVSDGAGNWSPLRVSAGGGRSRDASSSVKVKTVIAHEPVPW